jgi:hypothetical protein
LTIKEKQNKLPINILNYKKYYAFIDIESYNDINYALPYDISIYIMLGNEVIKKYCLLYIDVFNDLDRQDKCYYKDKIPQYEYQQHLKENKDIEFVYLSKYDLCKYVNNIINKYNISLIIGYNINFDYKAINRLYSNVNTTIKINKRRYKDFKLDYKSILPTIKNEFQKVNYLDLWYVITELFTINDLLYLGYIEFCLKNDYLTPSSKYISSKEEHIFNYLIDATHQEWHLGFKDVIDEIQVYKHIKQLIRTRILDRKQLLKLNTKAKISIYNLNYVKQLLKKYNKYDLYKDKL